MRYTRLRVRDLVKYELITLGTDLGTSLVLKAHRRDTAQVGPSRL